jgi:ribosome-associated toxin RatA of RatAB toxin-antitoxin module
MAIMPGKYEVEKSITINKSADVVYDKIANLNHYREWNPWAKMEPTAKVEITGTPKTLGHKYHWTGKKIGEGFLQIRSFKENETLDIHLEFLKPWKSLANDCWAFKQEGNGTKVTWTNDGPLPFGMARLMGPMITKNLNKQFDEGLQNLKQLCEA